MKRQGPTTTHAAYYRRRRMVWQAIRQRCAYFWTAGGPRRVISCNEATGWARTLSSNDSSDTLSVRIPLQDISVAESPEAVDRMFL